MTALEADRVAMPTAPSTAHARTRPFWPSHGQEQADGIEDWALKIRSVHAQLGDNLRSVTKQLTSADYKQLRLAINDAHAGNSSACTLALERLAPEAFAAAKLNLGENSARVTMLRMSFKDRFHTLLAFVAAHERGPLQVAEDYVERSYARILKKLPKGWQQRKNGLATMGSELSRIVELSRSSYKKERQLAARDAKKLMRFIEPLVSISVWDSCPLDGGVTKGSVLIADALLMKSSGMTTKQIAAKTGLSDRVITYKTAGAASRLRQRQSEEEKLHTLASQPIFDDMACELLSAGLESGDARFTAGLIAVRECTIASMNIHTAKASFMSNDIAQLYRAKQWLMSHVGIEADEFMLRSVLGRNLPESHAPAEDAAAKLDIPIANVTLPFRARRRSVSPTGVVLEMFFVNGPKRAYLKTIISKVLWLKNTNTSNLRRPFANWAISNDARMAARSHLRADRQSTTGPRRQPDIGAFDLP